VYPPFPAPDKRNSAHYKPQPLRTGTPALERSEGACRAHAEAIELKLALLGTASSAPLRPRLSLASLGDQAQRPLHALALLLVRHLDRKVLARHDLVPRHLEWELHGL